MPFFVVSHRPEEPLVPNKNYKNIFVGADAPLNQLNDRAGDSIANLNPYFCELTAIYWVWKNWHFQGEDFFALLHYRRLLTKPNPISLMFKIPASESFIRKALKHHDIILPRRIKFPNGLRTQYLESLGFDDMKILIDVTLKHYDLKFDLRERAESPTEAHMFNIFMCNANILKSIRDWMFPVLFEVHERLDYRGRTPYQQRAVGFLSERLINFWLLENEHLRVRSLPIIRTNHSGPKNLRAWILGQA